MIGRLFLVVGLTFIAFSICGLFIIVLLLHLPGHSTHVIPLRQPLYCWSNCSGGGEPPTDMIIDGDLYSLEVQYEAPKQMDINISDTITVMLAKSRLAVLPGDFTHIPTYSAANRDIGRTLVGDAAPDLGVDVYNHCSSLNEGGFSNCLDSTPVKDIFGGGYEVYASSHLIATGFEIQLLGSEEQSASQSSVEWTWNISPKSAGIQMINVDVELRWKPTNSGGEDIMRQIWQAPITIEVDKPFLEMGQITISSAITGFLGTIFTGFSLIWIYEERKKRQETKIKTNETKASYERQGEEQRTLEEEDEFLRHGPPGSRPQASDLQWLATPGPSPRATARAALPRSSDAAKPMRRVPPQVLPTAQPPRAEQLPLPPRTKVRTSPPKSIKELPRSPALRKRSQVRRDRFPRI